MINIPRIAEKDTSLATARRLLYYAATGLLLFGQRSAYAAYIAIGPIEGNVCRGFIIEACKTHRIEAVKGSDGKLYTVKTEFEKVDEFNDRTGRCFIKTKSMGAGLLSLGVNPATQPSFFTKYDTGAFKELDVEYLTFKCKPK